jgi:hypothetical protein
VHKHLKHKRKKLRYNNHSLLKEFRRFFTGDLCRLLLETKYLDGL